MSVFISRAESAEAGDGDNCRVDSWMIAHQGNLAVAALVHGGSHGAGAAGAAVERFLRNLHGR